jgi:hypothetical protein
MGPYILASGRAAYEVDVDARRGNVANPNVHIRECRPLRKGGDRNNRRRVLAVLNAKVVPTLNAELVSHRAAKLALLLSSFRRRLGSYDACDKFMVLRRVDEYVGRGCASLSLALALSLPPRPSMVK